MFAIFNQNESLAELKGSKERSKCSNNLIAERFGQPVKMEQPDDAVNILREDLSEAELERVCAEISVTLSKVGHIS